MRKVSQTQQGKGYRMTDQLDLFIVQGPRAGTVFSSTGKAVNRPPCEEQTTGLREPARRTDPLSSKLAAADVEKSGLRRHQIEHVVAVVKAYPGMTSRELSMMCPTLDRYTLARRLPDAEKLGLVTRAEKMKRCSCSGRLALTWRAN